MATLNYLVSRSFQAPVFAILQDVMGVLTPHQITPTQTRTCACSYDSACSYGGSYPCAAEKMDKSLFVDLIAEARPADELVADDCYEASADDEDDGSEFL